MSRPRKQTYTLDRYLKKNISGEIDNNADVQRNFAWKNEHINELIVTILTDDYIPPIILGEEENSKLHIVDGGCRTAALIKFRKMNYKITSSIENSLIPYKKKVTDKNGKITYENAIFDIKNKTFDKLPDELKEAFDEYQIDTVIHECCDSSKISKYIKRYNNHVSMNTDQKAFTYIDKFASKIHEILDSKFFVECNNYSENEKMKGVIERIVVEAMMCMYHFDSWKKSAKASCQYLNDNATEEEFDNFADNLHRLENIIDSDISDIFNKKDSFVFFALFNRFVKLGVDDSKFADFLREFKVNLRPEKRNKNGLLFDEIDKGANTKDRQVVSDKLNMLENLMTEFLAISKQKENSNAERFISENLDMDITSIHEDIDCYNESLDELLDETIRDGSRLRDPENRLSLLTMVAYSYKNSIQLEDWLLNYAKKNNTYFVDQKRNYIHMKNDFKNYCREHKISA